MDNPKRFNVKSEKRFEPSQQLVIGMFPFDDGDLFCSSLPVTIIPKTSPFRRLLPGTGSAVRESQGMKEPARWHILQPGG